jgi:hypothetical protein
VGNLYAIAWITIVLEVDNFSVKKKSSKHINMGSSFEDLVETSPSVKTDFQSDKRFELQNILNIRTLYLMRMTSTVSFIVHVCRLGRR